METRHFARAAALEHIAPSVLSTQIRRLEVELGLRLFDRDSHSVTVTPSGRQFLSEAQGLSASLDALRDATQRAARSEKSVLRVGVFGEGLGELTHLLFASFSDRFPEVALSFTELFMHNQIAMLHERQVDVAFMRLPVEDPDLLVVPLFQEPVQAAVSARDELAESERLGIEDIIDRRFAVASGGTPEEWASFWSLDHERGTRSRVGAQVTTLFESFSTVAYSDIIDTVPASAARTMPHPGVAFVPVADLAPSTLALVSRKDSAHPHVPDLTTCIIDLVHEHLTVMAGAQALV